MIEAWWQGTPPVPTALLDIAREGITRRAEALCVQRTLTASERLRAELNTALLCWETVPGTPVQARGRDVSIGADTELVAAVAAREEAARRRVALSWQSRQRMQQLEQMCSLLVDPLRATAWWFLDNQDKPEQAVSIAQCFQQLRDTLRREQQRESTGHLVDEFLATADDAGRLRLAVVLDKVFNDFGHAELADRLYLSGEGGADADSSSVTACVTD